MFDAYFCPRKKAGELISAQSYLLYFALFEPWESSLLKALLIEPETIMIPLQDLYPVAAPVAEYEHGRLK